MSRFHEERGNVTRLHIKEEVIQESLEKHQNILPEGKPKCFPVVRFKKIVCLHHLTRLSLSHPFLTLVSVSFSLSCCSSLSLSLALFLSFYFLAYPMFLLEGRVRGEI